MRGTSNGSAQRGKQKWLSWENTFRFAGLSLLLAETVNAEFLGGTFHSEFLLAGLALCGISIAQGWDKRKQDS